MVPGEEIDRVCLSLRCVREIVLIEGWFVNHVEFLIFKIFDLEELDGADAAHRSIAPAVIRPIENFPTADCFDKNRLIPQRALADRNTGRARPIAVFDSRWQIVFG